MDSRSIRRIASPVEVTWGGRTLPALPGETVAAALAAAGLRPRLFCGMGVCFGCRVTIDGTRGQLACLVKVSPGMRIGPDGPVPECRRDPESTACEDGHAPVLVVGAGPAGLAAALAAASRGLAVTVLDERDAPGGQYYKPLAASHTAIRTDRQARDGLRLTEQVRQAGVVMVGGATVWHARARAGGGAVVQVVRGGRNQAWVADRLIVAAGAYERAWTVPGWTLPGVMTTGAAQGLVRSNRVAPGRSVLIAGNGPLNLQLAAELLAAGVRVVALAEAAAPPFHAPGAALRMATVAPGLVRDGVRQLAALARAGVPILHRHVLVRVDGTAEAQAAVLARVAADGRVVVGSERHFAVDCVCIGYGFLPQTELTELLGARHRTDPTRRGAGLVDCDGMRRTSLPGVYAAGDGAGPLGARAALAQGTLAGHAAADDLGRPPAAEAVRTAARQLRQARRFQAALWQVSRHRTQEAALATAGTVLCRCEGVTFDRVRLLLADGAGMGALKRATRCGMGVCQGRYCGPLLAGLCGADAGAPGTRGFTPQAPVRPVPAGALAVAVQPVAAPQVTLPPRQSTGTRRRGTVPDAAITVIGGGIVGICTAHELARAGADVLLVERGEPNGEASGGNAGSLHVQLLGYAFAGLDSEAARAMLPVLPLGQDAAQRWESLATTLDTDIELRRNGGFSVADTPELVRRLEQKAALEREAGLRIELLSGAEARRRAPSLSGRILAAAFSPDEGQLNPLLAGPAILRAAQRAGLRVLRGAAVLGIVPERGGYRLRTSAGDLWSEQVLNAAGAWSAEIASHVDVSLPIRAAPLQMMVTEPVAPILQHLVAHVQDRLTLKQARNGNVLIGGGWRAELDPASGRQLVTVAGLRGNLHTAIRTLPLLRDMLVLRSWTAMNVGTVGPPIISTTAEHPGLLHVATANGLTLGPVIGRICADLLLGRRPPFDPAPFRLPASRREQGSGTAGTDLAASGGNGRAWT